MQLSRCALAAVRLATAALCWADCSLLSVSRRLARRRILERLQPHGQVHRLRQLGLANAGPTSGEAAEAAALAAPSRFRRERQAATSALPIIGVEVSHSQAERDHPSRVRKRGTMIAA